MKMPVEVAGGLHRAGAPEEFVGVEARRNIGSGLRRFPDIHLQSRARVFAARLEKFVADAAVFAPRDPDGDRDIVAGQDHRTFEFDAAQIHGLPGKKLTVNLPGEFDEKRSGHDHHVVEAVIGKVRQRPQAKAKLHQPAFRRRPGGGDVSRPRGRQPRRRRVVELQSHVSRSVSVGRWLGIGKAWSQRCRVAGLSLAGAGPWQV